jgi:hypothetical protein
MSDHLELPTPYVIALFVWAPCAVLGVPCFSEIPEAKFFDKRKYYFPRTIVSTRFNYNNECRCGIFH